MSGGVEDVRVWNMTFENVAYAFRLKVLIDMIGMKVPIIPLALDTNHSVGLSLLGSGGLLCICWLVTGLAPTVV
jgi:hypothetical protein